MVSNFWSIPCADGSQPSNNPASTPSDDFCCRVCHDGHAVPRSRNASVPCEERSSLYNAVPPKEDVSPQVSQTRLKRRGLALSKPEDLERILREIDGRAPVSVDHDTMTSSDLPKAAKQAETGGLVRSIKSHLSPDRKPIPGHAQTTPSDAGTPPPPSHASDKSDARISSRPPSARSRREASLLHGTTLSGSLMRRSSLLGEETPAGGTRRAGPDDAHVHVVAESECVIGGGGVSARARDGALGVPFLPPEVNDCAAVAVFEFEFDEERSSASFGCNLLELSVGPNSLGLYDAMR